MNTTRAQGRTRNSTPALHVEQQVPSEPDHLKYVQHNFADKPCAKGSHASPAKPTGVLYHNFKKGVAATKLMKQHPDYIMVVQSFGKMKPGGKIQTSS
jgi:hypothetical protein